MHTLSLLLAFLFLAGEGSSAGRFRFLLMNASRGKVLDGSGGEGIVSPADDDVDPAAPQAGK
jgi:hypothetical protein